MNRNKLISEIDSTKIHFFDHNQMFITDSFTETVVTVRNMVCYEIYHTSMPEFNDG